MKYLSSIVLAFAVAACGPQQTSTTQAAPPPAPGVTPADVNTITSQGWGPLRIGMTRAEVTAAVGATAAPNSAGGGESQACDLFHPANAPEGMLVMIQQDRLSSITLRNNTTLKTDRDFGVGDNAAAIKEAYGASAQVLPHHYIGAPAEYITVWSIGAPENASAFVQDPNARGIRYETDANGVVTAVHAGGDSIQYVEGCS